ncbi:MAG: hypothetical protein KDA57_00895 [Planctomycetales bacterium]|nr:hypothetical protein [Planctomycetales bacterium]
MEEPLSLPDSGRDRSAQTAELLRILREQADQSLDVHRRRLSNIESDLNLHIQQITEELARDRVTDELEVAASEQMRSELQRCRELLVQVEVDLSGLRDELGEANDQLVEKTGELDQLREQFQRIDAERAELASERDQLQGSLAHADAELKSLHGQLAVLSDENGAQLTELAEELKQSRLQFEETRSERDHLAGELEQLRGQHHEVCGEREHLAAELESAIRQRDELQHRECSECKHFEKELTAANQRTSDIQQEMHSLREDLRTAQEQHGEVQSALESSEANHEKISAQLREAEQRIIELSDRRDEEEQLEEMQRKFELAHADVHKLKRENAELQEELSRRPESGELESPELVSLRAERDAMAIRIKQLESAPPQESDAEAQQAMADLQRRFEMAVEDVRHLKQANAALQEQIKDAPSVSPVVVDDGAPLDWQAQKARLLAELDAEDQGSITPERCEARTTIEGTISITDRVVAEKDDEINRLRELLESQKHTEAPRQQPEQTSHEELFDQDEVIQAERKRLEEVRLEMEEKLRTAELEISVKRATLAREQAALEEKLAQIPQEAVEEEKPVSADKPRRRWLSALGLKDDEDE